MKAQPQQKQVKKPRINFPEKISIKQKLKEKKQIPPIKQPVLKQLCKIDETLEYEKIKLVLLGDGNCGKTSALISYTTDKFDINYTPTIFDSYELIVKKGNDNIKLQLWDTAGQNQYKMLRSLSYPKTDVFLLCFSMVDKKTFANALNQWFKQIQQNNPRAQVIFVGTKTDLICDYLYQKKLASEVLEEEKVAKKITSMGYKFYKCSALTQDGLSQIFDSAIDAVLKKRRQLTNIKKADTQCQII